MKLTQKLAALASTAMLLTNVLASGVVHATSSSGTLSAGSLGAQVLPGAITLSGAASSAYQASGLVGSLTDITITDQRGSAAGWTATSSVDQNFNLAGASAKKYISGSGTTTALGGEWVGGVAGATCQGTWTANGTIPCGAAYMKVLTVDGGNIPATVAYWNPGATFDTTVTGVTGATVASVATAAGVISADGVTGTFTGTWTAYDYIRLSVDYFPVTSYLVGTASGLTADAGYSTAGMSTPTSNGSAYTVSEARTDISAPAGTGAGVYTYDFLLAQGVHGNALSGTYNSAMTFALTSL